jgi:hypothetical protein
MTPLFRSASRAKILLALIAFTLASPSSARAQLTFTFNYAPDIDPRALAGFQEAAARWAVIFNDPINVTLNIGFQPLDTGILGSTATTRGTVPYFLYKAYLAFDATSSADRLAVSSLPSGSSFNLLLNRTSNSPFGSGSVAPYLDDGGDANNSLVNLTLADARALGLYYASGGLVDASITFSSTFNFDFNPDNGIAANAIDFVGVATHEIGHALGFISGVDVLDTLSSPAPDDAFTYVSPLDLYRYSLASYADGAIDWTADQRAKYFSIDGGKTPLALFSTGAVNGDGRQASHWKDNYGFGIMDPTTAYGELDKIGPLDITALDVIGFNIAIPEPSTYGIFGALLLMTAAVIRRKRTQ